MLLKSITFLYKVIHQPNNILSNFYVSQTTSQPTLWLKQSFPLQLLATQPKCVSVFLDLWKNYQACEPLFGYSLNSPHHPYFVLFFSPVAHSNALTFKDLMCVWQDPVHGILFVVFLVPEHVFPNLILCFFAWNLVYINMGISKAFNTLFPIFLLNFKKNQELNSILQHPPFFSTVLIVQWQFYVCSLYIGVQYPKFWLMKQMLDLQVKVATFYCWSASLYSKISTRQNLFLDLCTCQVDPNQPEHTLPSLRSNCSVNQEKPRFFSSL